MNESLESSQSRWCSLVIHRVERDAIQTVATALNALTGSTIAEHGSASVRWLVAIRLVPIPTELWHRLAALDARCHISLIRTDQFLVPSHRGGMIWSGIGQPKSQRRRVWHVRIYPRTEGRVETHQILDVHEPHLADAMAKAVEESERRGWHRPIAQDLAQ